DYLAIVTLGFGEIIRVIFLNTESLGGARGLFGIIGPQAIDLGVVQISSFSINCWLAYLWTAITVVVIWRWT
ncbi:high-affinity branched-chain amino acid ABC transporter permease LivM, partial [Pseudomonas aeruginosa]